MDFSKFDSRKASETPRELQLEDPVTGEKLFADAEKKKPCLVLVIGSESATAQAALRELRKSKVADEAKAEDEQSIEGLHGTLVVTAKPLIRGFKDVARGDRPATLDDLDWFLNLQLLNGREKEKSFVEQIVAFATSRSNFMGNASPV